MVKNPFDIALYTKLLFHLKPKAVIEIGTYRGGSALWFADVLASYGLAAQVISIDVNPPPSLADDRLTFIRGDALNLAAAISPAMLFNIPRPLLVIDDGAHTYESCLAALRFFHPHLRSGEYIVVEDGIVDDLPPHPTFQYGRGPNGAIMDFLAETGDQYMIDSGYCDFFGHNFTWNTNGYLRRQ